MQNILNEVKTEVEYQRNRWGTEADDRVNTPMDFVGYIAKYSTRWFDGGFRPYTAKTLRTYRTCMVKVAALAVAAIVAADKLLEGQNERPDILRAA